MIAVAESPGLEPNERVSLASGFLERDDRAGDLASGIRLCPGAWKRVDIAGLDVGCEIGRHRPARIFVDDARAENTA